MTDNKAPAYPWYPRDFTNDEPVQLMSLEEEGAYRRLLDHQWLNGSIPAEVEQIAKVCKNITVPKMRRLWAALASCFVPVDGDPSRLHNRKLERVRRTRDEYLERQSSSGRRGAELRWERERARHSEPNGNPNGDPISTANSPDVAKTCLAFASASAKEEALPQTLARRVKRQVVSDDEQAVVDHYRTVHPKRLRGAIPDKVLRLLRVALKSYPATDLCRAIDGNAASQFHRDGGHLGLDLILRDASKIDYFLDLAGKATNATLEMTDEMGEMRLHRQRDGWWGYERGGEWVKTIPVVNGSKASA